LSKLEKETIGSWEDLTKQFTSNFRSTYKRPASIEEVKACVQQCGETLRAYIQRWSLIKNSAVKVSDKRAIDAFIIGLRRGDLVEEMGRIKPKTVSELMDVANRFADGEDACNNKRTRSPEDDRRNRYGSQRRRSHNYDNYGSHSQVAAGYKDNSYQGSDRRSSGYRSYGKEDYKKISRKRIQRVQPVARRHVKWALPYTLSIRRWKASVQARNERLHNIPETTRSSTKQAIRSKATRVRRKQQTSHKSTREQWSSSRTRPAKPGTRRRRRICSI
jgi:hypothetical protein